MGANVFALFVCPSVPLRERGVLERPTLTYCSVTFENGLYKTEWRLVGVFLNVCEDIVLHLAIVSFSTLHYSLSLSLYTGELAAC